MTSDTMPVMAVAVVLLTIILTLSLGSNVFITRYFLREQTRMQEFLLTRDDALTKTHADQLSTLPTQLLESVSAAVERQMTVIQDGIKTAWSPNPSPQTNGGGMGGMLGDGPLHPKVKALYEKYNLPVPLNGLPESDDISDPTDGYLSESGVAYRPASMMMSPEQMIDSDEPFGVPGLKAIV